MAALARVLEAFEMLAVVDDAFRMHRSVPVQPHREGRAVDLGGLGERLGCEERDARFRHQRRKMVVLLGPRGARHHDDLELFFAPAEGDETLDQLFAARAARRDEHQERVARLRKSEQSLIDDLVRLHQIWESLAEIGTVAGHRGAGGAQSLVELTHQAEHGDQEPHEHQDDEPENHVADEPDPLHHFPESRRSVYSTISRRMRATWRSPRTSAGKLKVPAATSTRMRRSESVAAGSPHMSTTAGDRNKRLRAMS